MNPQDRDSQDRSRHVQASSRRTGGSSPADTRSNAATGLTQQGRANQRPQGERSDPGSEVQAGSSRDGRLAQQGSPGTAAQGERRAANPGLPQSPGEDDPKAARKRS